MKILPIVALAAFLMIPAVSLAKPAKCAVSDLSLGAESDPVPCDFKVYPGGTFSIYPVVKSEEDSPTFFGASVLHVDMVAPGKAIVSGTAYDSDLGRDNEVTWGLVLRSKAQPACWAGKKIKVCVY